MEIGTAERLTAAASYDLLRRLTEKGVISKERFAKLCSLLRQYNQGTMLPIAENLSDYIVSLFEIRERRATMPITAPFLQKNIVPGLYCLTTVKYAFQPERIMALFWNLR